MQEEAEALRRAMEETERLESDLRSARAAVEKAWAAAEKVSPSVLDRLEQEAKSAARAQAEALQRERAALEEAAQAVEQHRRGVVAKLRGLRVGAERMLEAQS